MNRLIAKYIFNEASPRERERVERWIEKSPANREEMERLRVQLELATRRYRPGMFDPRAALSRVVSPRRISRAVLVAAAAVVLLLAGLPWLLLPGTPREITITALAGETRACLLPDGSRVTLSGPASLSYLTGFNRETREVIASGTAYFEVKSDPRRPFTVTTALLEARVLGTVFQVEGDATRSEVLVREGRVRVTPAGGHAGEVLLAGMSATRLAGGEALTVSASFDANRLSWKTGEFRFDNTPLSEVIELLERHFRVAIPLPEHLASLRITASFRRPTLPEVLDIINQTLDVTLVAE
jgi:ferric-dicitrate binding protein FerR (iron transport regulator)